MKVYKISSVHIVIICFLLIPFAGCINKTDNGITKVRIQQEWFEFSGFAGEVSAAKRFAKVNGLELNIVPGAENISPITLVMNGTADFGVVAADVLVEAINKGAPLIAVGVVNHKSPTCFLVHKDSDISTPKDFLGKTVGILEGTNTERVYRILMKELGIDRKQIKEIAIPFNLTPFLLGKYDVRPAFIYDETVSLERQGIEYKVIDPTSYGIDFIGTVYFTRRSVVEKKRSLVSKVVKTLIQGWSYTIENPTKSINDLLEFYPRLELSRELRSLEIGISYFEGENGRPLTASESTWRAMIKSLEGIEVIPVGAIKVDDVWDSSFVEDVYEKK